MLYQAAQYLKFLFRSTNQHGVHSPFVYHLVTQCFYDQKTYGAYSAILNYKKCLNSTPHKIKVTDLGAGSRINQQKTRAVTEIAKNAGSTYHRAKLLFRLTQYFKPQRVLELGTSLGIATQAMALGHPNAQIISIEGCKNISEFTTKLLKEQNIKNVSITTDSFFDAIQKLPLNQFDLIFFDGNHQKEATLQYFETLLDTAHNDSVFIFDDIYWSKGMTQAWQAIKAHPKVRVTIDTFFWGFVFFRKEQAKEHFSIRL